MNSKVMEEDKILKRWLNEELSSSEREAFEQSEEYALHKAIVDEAQFYKASLHTEVKDYASLKAKIEIRKNSSGKGRSWYKYAVAALVLIAFGLYFLIGTTTESYKTGIAASHTISLPDHSEAILSAVSSLSYDEGEWSSQREVYLEGEAYFKVAKGKRFNVITSEGIVSVVGTQFSVQQRDGLFQVRCYEGLVKVMYGGNEKLLSASDRFVSRNGEIAYTLENKPLPSWSSNLSTFDEAPYEEVLSEFKRHFDVKISAQDINLQLLFTGAFHHSDLENALKAITEPMALSYALTDDNKVILSRLVN